MTDEQLIEAITEEIHGWTMTNEEICRRASESIVEKFFKVKA